MLFQIPLWGWITLLTCVCIAVALILYFFVFHTAAAAPITSFTSVNILDTNTQSAGFIRPGDTVTIGWQGSHKGFSRVLFSHDQSITFDVVTPPTGTIRMTFAFTIPQTVFSDTCVIRVSDLTNATQFADSYEFSVTPQFVATGPGSHDADRVLVSTGIQYTLVSEMWDTIIKSGGVILSTQASNQKTWVVEKNVAIDANAKTVHWQIPLTYLDTSKYVQISTTSMVAAGYARELRYTMPYALNITSTTQGFTLMGAFIFYAITKEDGSILSNTEAGGWVQLLWATNVTVSRIDVSWATSPAGPFALLTQGIDGTRGNYEIKLPTDLSNAVPIYLRIQDESNSGNYALSTPITLLSQWKFATGAASAFIMESPAWTFDVVLQIDGFNAIYGDTSNWRTVLSFPTLKKTWDLQDARGLLHATSVLLPIDPPRNLYQMHYLFLTTELVDGEPSDSFSFNVLLSFNGAQVTSPLLYTVTFPPARANGAPIASIVTIPPHAISDKDIHEQNADIIKGYYANLAYDSEWIPLDSKTTFEPGQTVYLGWTGSNDGIPYDQTIKTNPKEDYAVNWTATYESTSPGLTPTIDTFATYYDQTAYQYKFLTTKMGPVTIKACEYAADNSNLCATGHTTSTPLFYFTNTVDDLPFSTPLELPISVHMGDVVALLSSVDHDLLTFKYSVDGDGGWTDVDGDGWTDISKEIVFHPKAIIWTPTVALEETYVLIQVAHATKIFATFTTSIPIYFGSADTQDDTTNIVLQTYFNHVVAKNVYLVGSVLGVNLKQKGSVTLCTYTVSVSSDPAHPATIVSSGNHDFRHTLQIQLPSFPADVTIQIGIKDTPTQYSRQIATNVGLYAIAPADKRTIYIYHSHSVDPSYNWLDKNQWVLQSSSSTITITSVGPFNNPLPNSPAAVCMVLDADASKDTQIKFHDLQTAIVFVIK